jgi:subtilisin family serine protease
VPGYDFLNDDVNVADPSGGRDSGHGTFVAGLIALAAPDARIMPIRVLDPSGQGDEIDVANGIYFAANHGANIVNLSLGSYLESKAVDAAVAYAQQHGVLVAAAAGNDNIGDPEYPATTSGVVGVAATDRFDTKASFSNYGNHITLSAPGTDLYSAYDNGQYAFGEGTSFATPLVTGVAALVWSAHPELSAEGVIEVLAADSTSVDALNPDYLHELGAGRVDAERAVGDRLITAPPGPVPSENGTARVDPSPSVPAGTLTDFPAQSSPTATPTDDPSQLTPVPVRTDEPSAVSATAISTDVSPQTSPTPTPTDEPAQVDASATPDGASSETGVTAAPTGDPAQVNPTATPTDDSAQPGPTPVPEGNPSPSPLS